jgi:hypothetical protein
MTNAIKVKQLMPLRAASRTGFSVPPHYRSHGAKTKKQPAPSRLHLKLLTD